MPISGLVLAQQTQARQAAPFGPESPAVSAYLDAIFAPRTPCREMLAKRPSISTRFPREGSRDAVPLREMLAKKPSISTGFPREGSRDAVPENVSKKPAIQAISPSLKTATFLEESPSVCANFGFGFDAAASSLKTGTFWTGIPPQYLPTWTRFLLHGRLGENAFHQPI